MADALGGLTHSRAFHALYVLPPMACPAAAPAYSVLVTVTCPQEAEMSRQTCFGSSVLMSWSFCQVLKDMVAGGLKSS